MSKKQSTYAEVIIENTIKARNRLRQLSLSSPVLQERLYYIHVECVQINCTALMKHCYKRVNEQYIIKCTLSEVPKGVGKIQFLFFLSFFWHRNDDVPTAQGNYATQQMEVIDSGV